MERLTKKQENKYWLNCSYDEQDAIQQLGKLEDIEQELGIPLEVLFKALKEEIWTYDYDKKITRTTILDFGLGVYGWYLSNMSYLVSTKDYGKTWALTKEELE